MNAPHSFHRLFSTLASLSMLLFLAGPYRFASAQIPPNPKPEEVVAIMEKAADWQLAHPSKDKPTKWTQGAYYTGMMALASISHNPKYLDAMREMGRNNAWKLGERPYHADDHAVAQTYCELYLLDKNPQMIAPTRETFDFVLEHPKTQSLDQKTKDWTNRWAWCDSLFMDPPAWARLYAVTGDKKYLDYMDEQWWQTTAYLYDPAVGLFSRDSSYFDKKSPNGQKLFWGRGNGWVYAGIARVLDFMPPDYPSRPRYVTLYREMTTALLKAQQPDGLWRASLLDPEQLPYGETSASALITYGLAWGVNKGILDQKTYWPSVLRAWVALTPKVQPDGMVGWVQAVGQAPEPVTDQSTEVYGTGAFLLAGSEIYQHLTAGNPASVSTPVAVTPIVATPIVATPVAVTPVTAAPVVAPPAAEAPTALKTPATWCRFVPERMDDFAWENDLTAFRAYGPAIKANKGTEDSGIDCWLKRVPYPIVDEWYAGDLKGISYHEDHGDGYDPYHVGASRGCGGLGIWKDGKLLTAGPFKEWKIISREPQESVFELTYDYAMDGQTIHEVKHITIRLGQRLFHAESTFTKDGKPAALDIAIGITTHDGKGAVSLNPTQGWMSVWEIIDGQGFGTGVVIAPDRVASMQEIKSQQKDASHALLITHTDEMGQVAYQAGYGWQKAGEITTLEKWSAYLASATSAPPIK